MEWFGGGSPFYSVMTNLTSLINPIKSSVQLTIPGSITILAGQTSDKIVAMPGAVFGDPVLISPLGTIASGVMTWGFVSAVDQVTVRRANNTLVSITPASTDWVAYLVKSS